MNDTTQALDTAFLRAAPLYSTLPEDVLRKIIERGSVEQFASGAVLFKPGDPTEEAYVVRSGVIEICREDQETGELAVVAYVGEGESVGEMILFTASPRKSTARVPQGAELFIIPRRGLIELCREVPDLALFFCRLFASRLESWVGRGRRKDAQKQLQGNLRFFDLATVLQTLGQSEGTGKLTIEDDKEHMLAELDFEDGRLAHARVGRLRGEHAFYQLFQPPPDGNFLFLAHAPVGDDPGERVNKNVLGLLMEAVRLQDEWTTLAPRYADADRVFLPAAPDLAWDDDATFVAAFDVWSFLHRKVRLERLLTELPYSPGVVLGILDRLANTNQIA